MDEQTGRRQPATIFNAASNIFETAVSRRRQQQARTGPRDDAGTLTVDAGDRAVVEMAPPLATARTATKQIPYASPHTDETSRWRRRAREAWAAVVLLVLAAAGGTYWGYGQLLEKDDTIGQLSTQLDAEKTWRTTHARQVTDLHRELALMRNLKDVAEKELKAFADRLAGRKPSTNDARPAVLHERKPR